MDKLSRRQACRSCDGMNSEDAKARRRKIRGAHRISGQLMISSLVKSSRVKILHLSVFASWLFCY